MALIQCPDCSRDVSSSAQACPHCGHPVAKPSVADKEFHGRTEGIFMKSMNCGCMVALGLIVFVLITFGVAMG